MKPPADASLGPEAVEKLLGRVRAYAGPPIRVMEVCGTHTVAVARMGLKGFLPPSVRLLSGPGCPVCVTPAASFDEAVRLVLDEGVILATYGDALRVPGTRMTLARARSEGGDVAVVYAATDALDLARSRPDREVVFFGLGFETTSPTVAHAVRMAEREGLRNFSVLSAHKALLPAMEALLADPEVRVGAFLCPGHASMVLGAEVYRPLAERYRIPCVVAGFEPADVLLGLALILRQAELGEGRVENAYPRAVSGKGNPAALALLDEVFTPADARWRGLGVLPRSGYELREAYGTFDARRKFPGGGGLEAPEAEGGCRCADVLRGILEPEGCPLFGAACTPDHPVGACMVSGEGACGAHHRYRGA
jgi:hydrogenase expression/formation protein HypD